MTRLRDVGNRRRLPDVYPDTLSRLPPLKRETLNKAQQKAYDALAAPSSDASISRASRGLADILRVPSSRSPGRRQPHAASELGLDARSVD